jgi:general secretion pathway protein E
LREAFKVNKPLSQQASPFKELLPAARTKAAASGRCLSVELLELAGGTDEELERLSNAVLGVTYLSQQRLFDQGLDLSQLSFTDCANRSVFPYRLNGQQRFAVADPWDHQALQWLSNKVNHYPVVDWSGRQHIAAALERAQKRVKASSEIGHVSGNAGQQISNATATISIETIERSASPIVRFVDSAIYDAWRAGASDIHFECDREGVHVKLRLDGVLVPAAELLDVVRAEEVISRIKVLAQLDIAERRIPQDGRFRVTLGDRELDFRVSIMPSIFGEDAVIRLLDKAQLANSDASISLESLGLDADAITRIRRLSKRPHGMLLVTGPTGSGKTTTLYAALSEIQTGQEKIVTIEDPVEYELPGVLQIPVNEKKGLTFSQGLRSILRHDPDKILVGEIRDSETAEIAVQAALTGHLVFTTVHANSVFDVISRFAHMDIDLYSLLSALNGVVAQRLIRCNCPHCTRPETAVSVELVDRFRLAGVDVETARFMRGAGCEHCRNTGYKGRYAIAEVLGFDDTIRTMILNRTDVAEVKKYARAQGIRPLSLRAMDLVVTGVTTIDEIDRVVAYE